MKPVVDRVAGAVLLVVATPLLAAAAAAVWATMGRPVVFVQERVGRHGRRFTMYKFRTMRPDRRRAPQPVGDDRRKTHKSADDPRLTPVGAFLRRWSLDELPQLWNVVNGTMSLVGPRPELPEIVATYEPWQHARHAVKPGLTGLWQVSARGDQMMHEATGLDLEYLERLSFRTDARILLHTLPAALGRRPGF